MKAPDQHGACLSMQHYMGVCSAALVRREAEHESLRPAWSLFEHAAIHGRLQRSIMLLKGDGVWLEERLQ